MSKRTIMRTLLLVAILSVPLTIYFAPGIAAFIFGIVGALAPLWLPIALIVFGFPLWLLFIRSHFVSAIPYSIIELKPGAETPRSARAMELVFYSLYHRTDMSLFEMYGLGHVRVPWAFEVSAHAGAVRFFAYVPTAHRAAVESRIRSEYRDIDIDQARDYAREISFNPRKDRLFMREYALLKADPYPLKTYASYESETNHRDVFSELLEELASVGDYEHVCLSFIVRPHQRERRKLLEPARDYLHEDARKEIVSLLGPRGDINAVSEETKRAIALIEHALKKPSFDCGVRALYVADRDHFSEHLADRLSGIFNHFNDTEQNGFQSYDPLERIGWPLSEVFSTIPALSPEYLLQLYRRRAFFAPPYYGKSFVLNTEELATVFHIPHFARASALQSMRGVRLEPPANLPV